MSEEPKQSKKDRLVGIIALSTSLLLHGGGLYFLLNHSLLLNSRYGSILGFKKASEEGSTASNIFAQFATKNDTPTLNPDEGTESPLSELSLELDTERSTPELVQTAPRLQKPPFSPPFIEFAPPMDSISTEGAFGKEVGVIGEEQSPLEEGACPSQKEETQINQLLQTRFPEEDLSISLHSSLDSPEEMDQNEWEMSNPLSMKDPSLSLLEDPHRDTLSSKGSLSFQKPAFSLPPLEFDSSEDSLSIQDDFEEEFEDEEDFIGEEDEEFVEEDSPPSFRENTQAAQLVQEEFPEEELSTPSHFSLNSSEETYEDEWEISDSLAMEDLSLNLVEDSHKESLKKESLSPKVDYLSKELDPQDANEFSHSVERLYSLKNCTPEVEEVDLLSHAPEISLDPRSSSPSFVISNAQVDLINRLPNQLPPIEIGMGSTDALMASISKFSSLDSMEMTASSHLPNTSSAFPEPGAPLTHDHYTLPSISSFSEGSLYAHLLAPSHSRVHLPMKGKEEVIIAKKSFQPIGPFFSQTPLFSQNILSHADQPRQEFPFHHIIRNKEGEPPSSPLSTYLTNYEIAGVEIEELSTEHTTSLSPQFAAAPEVDVSPVHGEVSRKQALSINQKCRSHSSRSPFLPSLDELHTLSFDEEFVAQVSVSPRRTDGRYLFSVSIQPRHPEQIKPITQNYTFLIDRSGNVGKALYSTYRDAVAKALSHLHEGDTFNILIFDDEIIKLSNQSVYYSPLALKSAKKFLQNYQTGYRFSTPNIFDLLVKMGRVAEHSPIPNTVFLLTSGKSLEDFSLKQKKCREFFLEQRTHFSLFAASASANNNDQMLDLLTRLCRGYYLHSETHAAFGRKFGAMIKHAGKMIAKQMQISLVNSSDNLQVELFPATAYLPDLYADKPFIIYGLTNRLGDLDLLFQGRSGGDWFNIRKRISLAGAETNDRKIEQHYAIHCARAAFENYLSNGLESEFEKAKMILLPFFP